MTMMNLPLIKVLSPELASKVLASMRSYQYKKDCLIASPGEDVLGIYFLTAGLVRFELVSLDGINSFIGIIRAGDIFGDCELLGDYRYFAQVVAHENCELMLLPKPMVVECCNESAPFALELARPMAEKLRQLQYVQAYRHQLSLDVYVARTLLFLAKKFGVNLSNGRILVDVHLSQEQLANILGKTRQSVSGLIQRWKELNWIEYHYGKIILCDMDGINSLLD